MAEREVMSRYFAQSGDDIVVRRRPRVWQSVADLAGWTLILIGVCAAAAFAWTGVQYVFAYWGMMG